MVMPLFTVFYNEVLSVLQLKGNERPVTSLKYFLLQSFPGTIAHISK
jgi:hypothetical protein